MFSSPIDNFSQLNGKPAQEKNKGSSLICDYGNSRMRSSSFRDEEAMISRKPGMAQGMLRNPNVPIGEESKPAHASKVQKIPTPKVFSSGLGSPEKSDEPHDGFSR